MRSRMISLLALLTSVLVFGLACGFLDSEVATVTYEEAIPVTFSVNASQLCTEDCDGPSEPSPQEVELADIELSVPLDLVAATGNEELRTIASRMRSLEITSIDYIVTDNDLTFDLPELELHVAPPNVTSTDHASSVHLTTLPVVAAETDVSTTAPARDEAVEPASDIFKNLDFTALGAGTPVIREGQPFPPSGDADLEMIINIRIVANPIDSL